MRNGKLRIKVGTKVENLRLYEEFNPYIGRIEKVATILYNGGSHYDLVLPNTIAGITVGEYRYNAFRALAESLHRLSGKDGRYLDRLSLEEESEAGAVLRKAAVKILREGKNASIVDPYGTKYDTLEDWVRSVHQGYNNYSSYVDDVSKQARGSIIELQLLANEMRMAIRIKDTHSNEMQMIKAYNTTVERVACS